MPTGDKSRASNSQLEEIKLQKTFNKPPPPILQKSALALERHLSATQAGKGQGKHRNHSAAISEGLLGQSTSLIIPQASSSGGITRETSNAILEATASIDNPLVMDLSKIMKSQKKKGGGKTKLKPM